MGYTTSVACAACVHAMPERVCSFIHPLSIRFNAVYTNIGSVVYIHINEHGYHETWSVLVVPNTCCQVHPPNPRSRPCCCLGLTRILYGNGFCSLVKMGGMWSLSLFTMATIFIAAFCKDVSIARRTLIRSATSSASRLVSEPAIFTCFTSRFRNNNLNDPLLPAYLLLCLMPAS